MLEKYWIKYSYTFSPCIQKTDDTPAALATACPDLYNKNYLTEMNTHFSTRWYTLHAQNAVLLRVSANHIHNL